MSATDLATAQPTAPRAAAAARWYADWQHPRHREVFDVRAGLDRRNLVRNFEGFNDVRLLKERVAPTSAARLLEVGCATGEFFRYLRLALPGLRYTGVDISRPAIERAKAKYPDAACHVIDPARRLPENLAALGLPRPQIVYAKDVIQHQVQPYEFLDDLLECATDMVILRCRTRDVGPSELDPARSCQYHYDGWMPYLVLNLDEVIAWVRQRRPEAEIVAYRHHMILGGRHNRYVPKELYLRETGTAETALGMFTTTSKPGRVTIQDRPNEQPRYTWDYLAKHALRQALIATGLRRSEDDA